MVLRIQHRSEHLPAFAVVPAFGVHRARTTPDSAKDQLALRSSQAIRLFLDYAVYANGR